MSKRERERVQLNEELNRMLKLAGVLNEAPRAMQGSYDGQPNDEGDFDYDDGYRDDDYWDRQEALASDYDYDDDDEDKYKRLVKNSQVEKFHIVDTGAVAKTNNITHFIGKETQAAYVKTRNDSFIVLITVSFNEKNLDKLHDGTINRMGVLYRTLVFYDVGTLLEPLRSSAYTTLYKNNKYKVIYSRSVNFTLNGDNQDSYEAADEAVKAMESMLSKYQQ